MSTRSVPYIRVQEGKPQELAFKSRAAWKNYLLMKEVDYMQALNATQADDFESLIKRLGVDTFTSEFTESAGRRTSLLREIAHDIRRERDKLQVARSVSKPEEMASLAEKLETSRKNHFRLILKEANATGTCHWQADKRQTPAEPLVTSDHDRLGFKKVSADGGPSWKWVFYYSHLLKKTMREHSLEDMIEEHACIPYFVRHEQTFNGYQIFAVGYLKKSGSWGAACDFNANTMKDRSGWLYVNEKTGESELTCRIKEENILEHTRVIDRRKAKGVIDTLVW